MFAVLFPLRQLFLITDKSLAVAFTGPKGCLVVTDIFEKALLTPSQPCCLDVGALRLGILSSCAIHSRTTTPSTHQCPFLTYRQGNLCSGLTCDQGRGPELPDHIADRSIPGGTHTLCCPSPLSDTGRDDTQCRICSQERPPGTVGGGP